MQVELFNSQEELFDISMFEIEQDTQLVNITKIAKVFGKNVNDWTRLTSTAKFLEGFNKKNPLRSNLVTKIGGNSQTQGTWVHRKLAIKFAEWISVDFEIWCNDKLDELFQTGSVSLNPPKTQLQIIAEGLIEAGKVIEVQTEQIKLLQPKAEYTDKVLTSISYFTTTQVAKELELTANALNKKLQDLGIHYKVSGQWVLKKNYQNLGYVETKTTPYYDSNQNLCTNHLTVWTEKGRNFIHNLLNPQLNNSLISNI